MTLISCECCGVTIDVSRKEEPTEQSKYYPKEPVFDCPCCKTKIRYFSGDYE